MSSSKKLCAGIEGLRGRVGGGGRNSMTTVDIQTCWIKIDQLDVTCFIISLFNAQHISNVSTSILRSLRLICWVILWVVLFWYDMCWCYVVVRLGWCGILWYLSFILPVTVNWWEDCYELSETGSEVKLCFVTTWHLSPRRIYFVLSRLIKIDQLLSLDLLFHCLLLNMFRMLVHPSSGAWDLLWIYFMCCIALVWCVLVLRCGSAGVVWYPYAGW